jgi:hypothetical protein
VSQKTTTSSTLIRRFATIWCDAATQMQRIRFRYERWRGELKLSDESAEIRHRWLHRCELEHLLVRAGFENVEFFGGVDRRPYDGKSEIIVIARTRG